METFRSLRHTKREKVCHGTFSPNLTLHFQFPRCAFGHYCIFGDFISVRHRIVHDMMLCWMQTCLLHDLIHRVYVAVDADEEPCSVVAPPVFQNVTTVNWFFEFRNADCLAKSPLYVEALMIKNKENSLASSKTTRFETQVERERRQLLNDHIESDAFHAAARTSLFVAVRWAEMLNTLPRASDEDRRRYLDMHQDELAAWSPFAETAVLKPAKRRRIEPALETQLHPYHPLNLYRLRVDASASLFGYEVDQDDLAECTPEGFLRLSLPHTNSRGLRHRYRLLDKPADEKDGSVRLLEQDMVQAESKWGANFARYRARTLLSVRFAACLQPHAPTAEAVLEAADAWTPQRYPSGAGQNIATMLFGVARACNIYDHHRHLVKFLIVARPFRRPNFMHADNRHLPFANHKGLHQFFMGVGRNGKTTMITCAKRMFPDACYLKVRRPSTRLATRQTQLTPQPSRPD